jgi:hypothetical protein
MTARTTAAITATLGGVLWVAAALLVLVGDVPGGLGLGADGLCFAAGAVVLAAAALAAGYATVAQAPLWLRVLVPVAVLLLAWILYASLAAATQALADSDRGADGVLVGGCGAVAVVAGVVLGLVRRVTTRRAGPGRRARTAGARAASGSGAGSRVVGGGRSDEAETAGRRAARRGHRAAR